MKKIDVIIPNYNGSSLIKRNLPEVIKAIESYDRAGIIISDDCSKKDEVEKLRKIISDIKKTTSVKITLILNNKNLGFSSNINRGAFASKAKFLVLLNSDVAPEKDFLRASMPLFDKDKKLFGIGFMDKSIEEEKTILRGRGVASWKKGFLVHKRGEVDKNSTFWISGGSSIVRRDIFEKLSGFDSLYDPFYWEDIDLSYRAQKSGYKILFERKSVVTHWHEEGAIKKHYKSNKVNKIAYRNQFYFIWKNITDLELLLLHIAWLPYHFLKALMRLDTPFILGFFSAIINFSQVLEKRNKQKKLYTKKDKEVIYS